MAANNVDPTIDDLMKTLRQEIESNISVYETFSSNDVDVKTELEKFFQNPGKAYVRECVDLFLPALTMALKMRGTIYKIDDAGQVSTLNVGPKDGYEIQCCFAQTQIFHVDPVLQSSTEHRCKGGTGHMKVCAPPPTPGNQGLIVIDSDSEEEYSGACARGDGDERGHGSDQQVVRPTRQ